MRAVRFAQSADGTALAWARSGSGPVLVRAANWLTHLDFDLKSPIWAHWARFFERNFDYIRYDERGCGLSDRKISNLDMQHWVEDLSAVVEASQVDKPFVLLGVSQGSAAAVSYAHGHPENVSRLILIGGYARGANHRGQPDAAELYKAIVDVFRLGWGKNNPAFQDVFTRRFIPGGNAEQRRWYAELCEMTLSAATGGDLLMARAEVNVEHLLAEIQVPTLVIHVRDDAVVPLAEGELLARRIPGAEFVVLEGQNHIIQQDEVAWGEVCALIAEFSGGDVTLEMDALTPREADVLKLICRALSNKEIARELDLTEKTVRNHASNLYAKIGVQSRQKAIVKMARKFGS